MFEDHKQQLAHGISEINRWVGNFIEGVERQIKGYLDRIKQLEEENQKLRVKLETYEPTVLKNKDLNVPPNGQPI